MHGAHAQFKQGVQACQPKEVSATTSRENIRVSFLYQHLYLGIKPGTSLISGAPSGYSPASIANPHGVCNNLFLGHRTSTTTCDPKPLVQDSKDFLSYFLCSINFVSSPSFFLWILAVFVEVVDLWFNSWFFFVLPLRPRAMESLSE